MIKSYEQDTIVALATASGSGAIGIVRLSGHKSFEIAATIFFPHSKKKLSDLPSHSVHLGFLKKDGNVLDECLATLFKGSRSYTGEPTVEFSCHGSPYIQQEIINLCVRLGARVAHAGEFTLRAFLNGKMDLSQAEAIADLIASDNETTHRIAMEQMRGGFSNEIKVLREEFLNFASLIELELDFSEEDVEFANRKQFQELLLKIQKLLSRLIDSYAMGNVLKQGIPVAIIGEPNVGKSTLLNAFLNEERAIVSDIAGTTRDVIEDEIALKGIPFRFIDTAGIRETADQIEKIGIERAFAKIETAQILLYLVDSTHFLKNPDFINTLQQETRHFKEKFPHKKFVLIANKSDCISSELQNELKNILSDLFFISAKNREGISDLEELLINFVNTGTLISGNTIVTNARHYESLLSSLKGVNAIQEGLVMGLSSDLLAIDIREVLYHFGEITGEITNDDILGNIFSKFCIGK